MRTTVNIADHLLLEVKKLAAGENTSITAIFEDSIRLYLAEHHRSEGRRRGEDWALPVSDAGAPVPGVDLNDTSELLELA